MSSAEMSLAQLANPETQRQIAAAGGNLPNLSGAAAAAEAEALKKVLDSAVGAATGILQGATSAAGTLVAESNELDRQVKKNQKAQADLAKARLFFQSTNNIYPLRKLIGMPTPREVLAQYPKIDEIPEGWTPPAQAAAAS
jgi:hypothetical protein